MLGPAGALDPDETQRRCSREIWGDRSQPQTWPQDWRFAILNEQGGESDLVGIINFKDTVRSPLASLAEGLL